MGDCARIKAVHPLGRSGCVLGGARAAIPRFHRRSMSALLQSTTITPPGQLNRGFCDPAALTVLLYTRFVCKSCVTHLRKC